uniref:Circadian input-output histidine kinase CikA n=1 Tax=Cyanothece sp. (strain PCC 7425 / ATCC 29141) TaxID=395961 RepID=B8HTL5_CYAP4
MRLPCYDSPELTGWFRNVVVKVKDGIAISFSNITDRKQADLARQQQEQHFKIALQTAKLGSWEHDLTTGVLTCSAQCKANFGLPPDAEFTHDTLFAALHPDDRPRVEAAIQRAIAQRTDYEVEERCYHPDGSLHWLIVRGRLVYDANDTPIRMVGVTLDITPQKQTEKTLRQSEERLRIAQQAANAGVWNWDIPTNQVTWSAEYYRLYGLDPARTAPSYQNWLNSVVEQDRDRVHQAAQAALSDRIDLNVEFRILHPTEGERWLTAIGQTLFDDTGQPKRMTGIALDITQRKQAEKTLQRYQLLSEYSRDIVLYISRKGQILEANQAAVKAYGYSRNELLNLQLADLRAIQTLPLLWQQFEQASEGGILFETIHQRKDGSQFPVEVSAQSAVIDGEMGVLSVIRDISDRRRSEIALRKSEEWARLAIQIGRVGGWRLYLDQNLVEMDERLREIWGESKDAVMVPIAKAMERIHPDDRERVKQAVYAAIDPASPGTYEIEYRIVWEDGSERWVLAKGQAQFEGEAGSRQAVDFFGTLLDITEHKQAETALRTTAERLGLALTAAKLGDWSWNAATDIVTFSEQAAAMFGIPPGPYMTWSQIQNLLHVDDRARARLQVEQAIAEHSDYDIEYRVVDRQGRERWIAAKGRAQYDSSGQVLGMLGVVQDITHRKQAEAEREELLARERAAREAAEQANRIKDEFLAVLSHELRSPLNPILGWSKLLLNGKLNLAKTQQALTTIERNARLQSELIEDLLDVSRILQGKLSLSVSSVDLASTIQAAIETVRLAAEAKSIQIETRLAPDVGLVAGDSTRLQQVVWNLVSNGVKFTPAGGRVAVRLEQLEQQAQITISDTGKGIAPDFLPHVFDYFRQEDGATTRKFGGLGLGLAIVRHLVELHGGTIQAHSPGEGLGATFTVRLPLLPTQPNRPSALPAPEHPPDLAGIQVLVVDDDTDTRDLVIFLLEQAGATVLSAASASEALLSLSQTQPDLLISDIGMPEMDGYMLLRQVRALPTDQGGEIPAIALTAYAGEIDHQQTLAAGFQHHIVKPVDPEVLIQTISLLHHTGKGSA